MRKKLELIQASRAIVPLLVVLVHVVGLMRENYNYNFLFLEKLSKSGGVDYFFILTGFMMVYVYQKHFGNKDFYKEFLYNRLTRLYPFYWLIALPLIPVFLLIPSLGNGNEQNIGYLIKSLLLIPQEQGPYIYVAWSLSFNVAFYLIFSFFIGFSKDVFVVFLISWGVLIFLLSFTGIEHTPKAFLINTNFLNFIIGTGIALVVNKVRFKAVYPVSLALGVVVFALAWIDVILFGNKIDTNFTYLIAGALLIYGIAGIDLNYKVTLPKWVNFLGDASFSIFLTHALTLSLVSKIISYSLLRFNIDIDGAVIGIALFLIAVLLGCVIHIVVEEPLFKFLRNRVDIPNKKLSYQK